MYHFFFYIVRGEKCSDNWWFLSLFRIKQLEEDLIRAYFLVMIYDFLSNIEVSL